MFVRIFLILQWRVGHDFLGECFLVPTFGSKAECISLVHKPDALIGAQTITNILFWGALFLNCSIMDRKILF